jgi:aryl-alcohol dehydrogenase-like predicted oxidoreductase
MTYATSDGTRRYAARFVSALDQTHFRIVDGLTLSSIGLGTYLGEPDAETNQRYIHALQRALQLGCNVLDTASNYRFQLSERAIGEALQVIDVARDEIFISTKGGYVPYEGEYPKDPRAYIMGTFIDTGIVEPEDFTQGAQHCIAPKYLAHQLAQSRRNLQLETIDLYYLHNPEGQLGELTRDEFRKRLRAAFEFLEQAVANNHIRCYGTATWNAYRQLPQGRDYLSLQDMIHLAREAAGDTHHFKAIQLPINLAMPEVLEHKNQAVNDVWKTVLEAARDLGVMVFASASLMQARLAKHLPSALRKGLGESLTDAQRALQFTRSLPNVTTALVGMSRVAHVEENLQLAQRPCIDETELQKVFGKQ